MKAKLTIALLAVLMIAAFAVPMALAEENDSADVSDDSSDAIALYNDTSNLTDGMVISPGPESSEETEVTPEMQEEVEADDNATVQFGQVGWNNFKLLFTWDQEKRAKIGFELARLRLIQARIAAKNNNTVAMEKALEAHQRIMERLNDTIAKIKEDSDMRGLNSSAVKFVGLQRAIQVHELKIERLNSLLEKTNLTDNQKAKIEARIAHVETVTAKLNDLNEAKIENIKTKLMAVKNMSEEEAGEFIVQKQETIRSQVQQKIQQRLGK